VGGHRAPRVDTHPAIVLGVAARATHFMIATTPAARRRAWKFVKIQR